MNVPRKISWRELYGEQNITIHTKKIIHMFLYIAHSYRLSQKVIRRNELYLRLHTYSQVDLFKKLCEYTAW